MLLQKVKNRYTFFLLEMLQLNVKASRIFQAHNVELQKCQIPSKLSSHRCAPFEEAKVQNWVRKSSSS
jgi:hypothetical protein